jgi:hypothetical protein
MKIYNLEQCWWLREVLQYFLKIVFYAKKCYITLGLLWFFVVCTVMEKVQDWYKNGYLMSLHLNKSAINFIFDSWIKKIFVTVLVEKLLIKKLKFNGIQYLLFFNYSIVFWLYDNSCKDFMYIDFTYNNNKCDIANNEFNL